MTNRVKQGINITTVVFMLLVTTFFVTEWFLDITGERRAIHNGHIPEAREMAILSVNVVQDQASFKNLQGWTKEAITTDAKRGARSTEIYVGRFDHSLILELQRQLHFQGYKTELTDGLGEKNTFLEISW